jgi:diguanylate cyclase (GGDEF)-like protein
LSIVKASDLISPSTKMIVVASARWPHKLALLGLLCTLSLQSGSSMLLYSGKSDRILAAGAGAEHSAASMAEHAFSAMPSGRPAEILAGQFTPDAAILLRVSSPQLRLAGLYFAGGLILLLSGLYYRRTRSLIATQKKLEDSLAQRTRELELSREAFRIRAMHDDLTGLLNRGAILEVLEREVVRASRSRTALTVILLDIDDFKSVNDTYGQLGGDSALFQAAAVIRNSVRDYDQVGRYGGEEFLMILPGLSPSGLGDRLASLHNHLSNISVTTPEEVFSLTCCFGATSAFFTDPVPTVDALLSQASRALWAAREGGRNRYAVLLAETQALPGSCAAEDVGT